jgi:hypothetical protein
LRRSGLRVWLTMSSERIPIPQNEKTRLQVERVLLVAAYKRCQRGEITSKQLQVEVALITGTITPLEALAGQAEGEAP